MADVERCDGVSDSQELMAKSTEVQPIILLRVKIAAIGNVEDIVLVTSLFSLFSGSMYGTTAELC